MRLIIAIIDTVTNDFAGPVQIHRHEAAAQRFFADIARMEGGAVQRYLRDHELVQLGTLDDDTLEITADKKILMTGKQFLAAQPSPEKAE